MIASIPVNTHNDQLWFSRVICCKHQRIDDNRNITNNVKLMWNQGKPHHNKSAAPSFENWASFSSSSPPSFEARERLRGLRGGTEKSSTRAFITSVTFVTTIENVLANGWRCSMVSTVEQFQSDYSANKLSTQKIQHTHHNYYCANTPASSVTTRSQPHAQNYCSKNFALSRNRTKTLHTLEYPRFILILMYYKVKIAILLCGRQAASFATIHKTRAFIISVTFVTTTENVLVNWMSDALRRKTSAGLQTN